MERNLCKKLDVHEDDFDEFNEIHLGVDDYYEYLAYIGAKAAVNVWKKNSSFLFFGQILRNFLNRLGNVLYAKFVDF